METATLTSPPRPVMVQPIQKSMSLPSYARASGEGIDHKLIFAALEQREKIRQKKNRIFTTKEKTGTSRQRSYFCLPLSSTSKCKETSLSSDTSCSSLEFQKPKYHRDSPLRTRKQDKLKQQNGVRVSDTSPPDEVRDKEYRALPPRTPSPLIIDQDQLYGRIKTSGSYKAPSPGESPKKSTSILQSSNFSTRYELGRNTLGSSDSMERTSRSSNDSLSRKERLVAMKARVEAERLKKLADSSSDDERTETSLKITRHNSDGVIVRTVREVKTKSSSRPERRFRRKNNPEEMMARRSARKQHTSLYLPSTTDLESWKPPVTRSGSSISLHGNADDDDEVTAKEDSSSFPSGSCASKPAFLFPSSSSKTFVSTKDSYHSDICSGSYRSRFVKPRVEEIEAITKSKKILKDGMVNVRKDEDSNQSGNASMTSETKNSFLRASGSVNGSKISLDSLDASLDRIRKCVSPSPRAPTPPPRSPKSIEFVNKAIIHHQHQNIASGFQPDTAYSLERKKMSYQARATTRPENSGNNNHSDYLKEVISSRRKTCSNFPMIEDHVLFSDRSKTPTPSQQPRTSLTHNFPPRSPDLVHKTAATATRKTKNLVSSPDLNSRNLLISSESQAVRSWEQLELESEKKFNSLDNLKLSSWSSSKFKCLPRKKRLCTCGAANLNHQFNETNSCLCSVDGADKPASPSSIHRIKIRGDSDRMISTSGFEPIFKPSSPAGESIKLDGGTSTRSSSLKSLETKNSFVSTQDDEKLSTENDTLTRQDATENLNTAMQELEDIYRSLRISCENLTEQAPKNMDINRITIKTELPSDFISTATSRDNLSLESPVKFIDEDPENDILNRKVASEIYRKPVAIRPFVQSGKPSVAKTKDSNAVATSATLCIEELFSDLTQQLDLEQKLLAESRIKKLPASPKLNSRTEVKKPPLSSVGGLEKKYISSVTTTTENLILVKSVDNPNITNNIEQRIMSKRKHKAIRSLSENLSNLIGLSQSCPVSSNNSVDQKSQSTTRETDVTDDDSLRSRNKWDLSGHDLKKNEELIDELLKGTGGNESKSSMSPTTLKKQLDSKVPDGTNPDGIWQIRVSMGLGDPPVKSSSSCCYSSAGATSNKDNNNRSSSPSFLLNTVLTDTVDESENCLKDPFFIEAGGKPIQQQQSSSSLVIGGGKLLGGGGKKSPSPIPINDAELEKLLTTLLGDVTNGGTLVPEIGSATASLVGVSSKGPSTCSSDSFAKGEMLVLQHIDVIRNHESS